MSIICLFPGQGSQSKGMGAQLFDQFPDWTAQADEVLGYSIRELCVDDPRGELVLTRFTQPALFTVNAMTYRARLESGKPAPAFVAGHSLGEFNALLAAGVFDFATGVRLVATRGRIMGHVSGGGMAAIIGLSPERIQEVLDGSEAGQRLDIANYNSFDQTVVAGPTDDILLVKPDFDAAGVRMFKPLNVSAPFHSRYMRAAETEFVGVLRSAEFAAPAMTVMSNVTGRPHQADADAVRDTLARQIGHSVRWLDSMLFLLDQPDAQFEEVGPGAVLTKLVAQIRKNRPAEPTSR